MPQSIFEKSLLVFVSVNLIVAVYFSHTDPDFFRHSFVVEDGFIEWCTVITLLAAMVICARRLVLLRKIKKLPFLIMTSLLTLFCLFGAGEEISWGQRIFDLEAPAFFEENNAQAEIGFHNMKVDIGGKQVKINKVVFGTGLALMMLIYLGVVTPLYRTKPKFREFIDSLAVTMPQNYHIVGYILVVAIVELLVDSSKRGEMTEFAGSIIFMLNIAFPYNAANFQNEKSQQKT